MARVRNCRSCCSPPLPKVPWQALRSPPGGGKNHVGALGYGVHAGCRARARGNRALPYPRRVTRPPETREPRRCCFSATIQPTSAWRRVAKRPSAQPRWWPFVIPPVHSPIGRHSAVLGRTVTIVGHVAGLSCGHRNLFHRLRVQNARVAR